MTPNPQPPTPSDPAAPGIPAGFKKMSPLEMNGVTFNSRRTVITPTLLEQMAGASTPSSSPL